MTRANDVILSFSDGEITSLDKGYAGEIVLLSTYNNEEIKSIGSSACRDGKLTKLDLRNTKIEHIKSHSFGYCYSLAEIYLPDTLLSIGDNAFLLTIITHLELPSSVTSFDSTAVNQAPYLESIETTNNANYLSYNGFLYDINKKELYFAPRSIETEEDIPFFDQLTTIKVCAFTNSKLRRFIGSESLKTIDSYAFAIMNSLSFLNLGRTSVTTFPANVIKDSSLTTVILPEKLTTLQEKCFYNVPQLSLVVIFQDVIDISQNIFNECDAVKRIIYFGSTDFYNLNIFTPSAPKSVRVDVTYDYPSTTFCTYRVNRDWYWQYSHTCKSNPSNHFMIAFLATIIL